MGSACSPPLCALPFRVQSGSRPHYTASAVLPHRLQSRPPLCPKTAIWVRYAWLTKARPANRPLRVRVDWVLHSVPQAYWIRRARDNMIFTFCRLPLNARLKFFRTEKLVQRLRCRWIHRGEHPLVSCRGEKRLIETHKLY